MAAHIAEVIESNTRQFVAEVYRDEEAPPFGAWVEVETDRGMRLLGLVSHVEVGSYEPGRRARAFQLSREELRREMPQVMELLCTTFRAQVVAHVDADGRVRQTLPPHPASIHDFVRGCTDDTVREVGRPYDFLRTLVRNPDPAVPVDDLVVAVLRRSYEAHPSREGEQALVAAGRALSRLLDDDHERLHSILRRIA